MIYFDTAYLVKCYLPELGFEQVRELLHRAHTAASSAVGRIEFTTAIRGADALHIVSARENKFQCIYTNDRQMLAAARHFVIEARNVIS